MAERSFSLPMARRVRQGWLTDTGCLVQTTDDATHEIPWSALRFLCVGRVEPSTTRTAAPPSGGTGASRAAARMMGGALGGLVGADDSSEKTEVQKGTPFLVLDLYEQGQEAPYRLDSTGTNLRRFLGQDAGYSGEINLVALLKKLAAGAPHAVHADVGSILERGKSAIKSYPDRDAFHAQSMARWRALPPVRDLASDEVLPTALPAAGASVTTPPGTPSWAGRSAEAGAFAGGATVSNAASWDTSHPSATSSPCSSPLQHSFDPTFSTSSASLSPEAQASRALGLSAAFVIGLLLLMTAAKMRFVDHTPDWGDAVFWILGGGLNSIAGILAIKGRESMREYLRGHCTVLRAWMVATAVGSLLFGVALGAMAYGIFASLGGIGSGMAEGSPRVSRYGGRALLLALGLGLGGAVGAVASVALAVNLLMLAAAPEEQLLTAPTVLDLIGLQ